MAKEVQYDESEKRKKLPCNIVQKREMYSNTCTRVPRMVMRDSQLGEVPRANSHGHKVSKICFQRSELGHGLLGQTTSTRGWNTIWGQHAGVTSRK